MFKKSSVIFYYLIPDLKFPPPIKKILLLLPTKFHFNHHWRNFYKMLFFSFKKGLNVQNHCDSHHYIKIPLSAKFPISQMGRYPKVSHRCWEHEGGGIGRGVKCCWKISVKEFMLVTLPAISLQDWKFTKNELLHTYFSRILVRF